MFVSVPAVSVGEQSDAVSEGEEKPQVAVGIFFGGGHSTQNYSNDPVRTYVPESSRHLGQVRESVS